MAKPFSDASVHVENGLGNDIISFCSGNNGKLMKHIKVSWLDTSTLHISYTSHSSNGVVSLAKMQWLMCKQREERTLSVTSLTLLCRKIIEPVLHVIMQPNHCYKY